MVAPTFTLKFVMVGHFTSQLTRTAPFEREERGIAALIG